MLISQTIGYKGLNNNKLLLNIMCKMNTNLEYDSTKYFELWTL